MVLEKLRLREKSVCLFTDNLLRTALPVFITFYIYRVKTLYISTNFPVASMILKVARRDKNLIHFITNFILDILIFVQLIFLFFTIPKITFFMKFM